MQGTPARSQTSATGLVVSGVEEVSIRSMRSRRSRSPATVAARSGSDWLSLTTISTGWERRPMVSPSRSLARTPSSTNPSASPKDTNGPLCGDT